MQVSQLSEGPQRSVFSDAGLVIQSVHTRVDAQRVQGMRKLQIGQAKKGEGEGCGIYRGISSVTPRYR